MLRWSRFLTLFDGFPWSANITFIGNDYFKLRVPRAAVAVTKEQKQGGQIMEIVGVRQVKPRADPEPPPPSSDPD